MVFEIGEILKGIVSTAALPYVQHLGGMARIETVKKQASRDTLVEKSFPIYCGLNETCHPNNTMNLVPDRKKKSLFYFESNGPVAVNDHAYGFTNMTAPIRLVVWLNPKELGSPDCSITKPIIYELINLFDKPYFNSGAIAKIKIRFRQELYRDVSIFTKYKYNRQSDLLEYPYDFFALDFMVDFSIHKNCLAQFTPATPIKC